jgi:hypothetical protein
MHLFKRSARVARPILLVLMAGLVARPALAQQRPAPAAELAVGALFFPDDGGVAEGLVGGNARVYLSPRISVGPEIAFVSRRNHSHLMLTGNVTIDALAPSGGRPRAVTPFFVAGAGLFSTREQFPRGSFTSSEGAFTAGGGVRALAGRRVTVGVEARIGWELHLRVNGTIGIRFGDS